MGFAPWTPLGHSPQTPIISPNTCYFSYKIGVWIKPWGILLSDSMRPSTDYLNLLFSSANKYQWMKINPLTSASVSFDELTSTASKRLPDRVEVVLNFGYVDSVVGAWFRPIEWPFAWALEWPFEQTVNLRSLTAEWPLLINWAFISGRFSVTAEPLRSDCCFCFFSKIYFTAQQTVTTTAFYAIQWWIQVVSKSRQAGGTQRGIWKTTYC